MDSQILAAQSPRAELLRCDRQPTCLHIFVRTYPPSRLGAELLHVDLPPIHTRPTYPCRQSCCVAATDAHGGVAATATATAPPGPEGVTSQP